MVEHPEIFWTNHAQKQLLEIYKYISKESLQNAIMVVTELTNAVTKTVVEPKKHQLDKYKNNNDGTYRAFEKYNYRVTYKIDEHSIVILRIRHTKMNPLNY